VEKPYLSGRIITLNLITSEILVQESCNKVGIIKECEHVEKSVMFSDLIGSYIVTDTLPVANPMENHFPCCYL
jgi:hypothetical protein